MDISKPFELWIYRLTESNVLCLDFSPSHVIAELIPGYKGENFWSGWPPPPKQPRTRKLVLFKDPFAKPRRPKAGAVFTKSSGHHNASAAIGPMGDIHDGCSVGDIPLDNAAGEAPAQEREEDGEFVHGNISEEENVDEDQAHDGETDNGLLETLIASAGLGNSVPSADGGCGGGDVSGHIHTVLVGPPAEEDVNKATDLLKQLAKPN